MGTRRWWRAQDSLFEQFIDTREAHLAELDELTAADGLKLDRSPQSLVELDDWVRGVFQRPFDDGASWKPVWTMIDPDEDMGHGWTYHQLMRLMDRLAWYYGEVAMGLQPGARWVCWRDRTHDEPLAGKPMVDMGIYQRPLDALNAGKYVIRSIWQTTRPPEADDYRPTQEETLGGSLTEFLDRRDSHLRVDPKLNFQGAPTGRLANRGRGPYKGKIVRWVRFHILPA
jgi:hypothetical protein